MKYFLQGSVKHKMSGLVAGYHLQEEKEKGIKKCPKATGNRDIPRHMNGLKEGWNVKGIRAKNKFKKYNCKLTS